MSIPDGISDPCGVILAGGLSRRMGTDKALAPLGDGTVLGHVIRRIQPQVAMLALNVNGDAAGYAPFGLPLLADPVAGHAGPLAGLLAGLEWARAAGRAWLVSVPVDTPFLPDDLVARLAGSIAPDGTAALARSAGRLHPVVGLWSTTLAGRLRAALLEAGIRRMTDWTQRIGPVTTEFPAAPIDPFFNLNSPEDLAAAEQLLADRNQGRTAPGQPAPR